MPIKLIKKKKLILYFSLSLIFLMVAGIFTHTGSRILTEFLLKRCLQHTSLDVSVSEGTLASGITYENLQLIDIKGLPKDSEVRIQKLFVDVQSFNISNTVVRVENMRLRLPGQNTILISGVLQDGKIDGNIFSTGLNLEDIVNLIPHTDLKKDFTADVSDLEVVVRGTLKEVRILGNMELNRFKYEDVMVTGAPVQFDLTLGRSFGSNSLKGNVFVTEGKFKTRKTIVALDESRFIFDGDPVNPRFNLKGQSRIDGVLIFVALEGTKEDSKVLVSSQPSLPRENLLIMLATGKRWEGVENSLTQKSISPDLVKDFVDYFLFAGKGSKFAEKFGLQDFFVNLERDRKEIGVKKNISDKMQIGYGVEQKLENQDTTVSQKLEGKYNLTNKVSIGVEREVKSMTVDQQLQSTTEEDKVMLKYKKSF